MLFHGITCNSPQNNIENIEIAEGWGLTQFSFVQDCSYMQVHARNVVQNLQITVLINLILRVHCTHPCAS